jgi:ATP-dependent RNA circularization protein (DNA/RNA ligase family)
MGDEMRERYYGYNRYDYYFPRTSREAFGYEDAVEKESRFHKVMMWLGWGLAAFLFLGLIGRW